MEIREGKHYTMSTLNRNFEGTEKKPLSWNVIDESSFRGRTRQVFEQVASTLVNTLGPYGATSIIEKFGELHITKDGWQILKKIAFNDNIENNILQLLVNISSQVVIKVGDGSTSSIVSAQSLLERLENDEELNKLRPKELINVLTKCANLIAQHIVEASTKINEETDPNLEEIYRLAMISTNGDEVVSRMIQEVYVKTSNPSIEFVKSRTNETKVEIINGYQGNISYLDGIYVNNDEGQCIIKKPVIMMFDHKLEREHYDMIQKAISLAFNQHSRLVVIAPHYDKYILEIIRKQANIEHRGQGETQTVFTRVSLVNNNFHNIYNDFSIMTGGIIIKESDMFDYFDEKRTEEFDVSEFLGSVDKITIGDKTTRIEGFEKRNEDMYQLALRDAVSKYKKMEEQHHELTIVDVQLYELKKRVSKLRGVVGVIHVGGNSGLEKTSNYDLVEDAVKACESAYSYGYNIGGNLIIPITIEKLRGSIVAAGTMEDRVLGLIDDAFRNVFTRVLGNKFRSESVAELNEIVNLAVEKQACYDLITDEYSSEVINPCLTDVEILKAATSIVSLLLSSNQYISISVDETVGR